MYQRSILTIMLLVCCLLALPAITQAQDESGEMPPMGPPEELKQITFMVGSWDFTMSFRMSDTTDEWVESIGTATWEMVLGGAAIEGTVTSSMMGMPFLGKSFDTYDRETGKFQSTWMDNVSARQVIYTGVRKDGKMILHGEERGGGMVWKSRITTSNITESAFDWLMEFSYDDGAIWWTSGKAKYTKKQ